MKKFCVFIFTAAVLLGLVSCAGRGDGKIQATPTEEPAQTAPATEPVQTEAPVRESPEPVLVSADYAGEELLSMPGTFEEFIDDDSEYQVKLVFTTNVPAKEFRYFRLSLDEKAETLTFRAEEKLYAMEELEPGRPLVIGMAFIGEVPQRGISFVDEQGVTRYYSINMSGKDGSILLVEF